MNKHGILVHQFFQVSRAMTNDLNQRLDEFNLTHAQLTIIDYLLFNNTPASIVEISKYLNVEKSTVSRAVNHLEKKSYVQRVASEDSRERRIDLCKSSKSTQPMILQKKIDFEKNTFKNISQEDLDLTYQTLLQIFENINGDDNEQHE